LKIFDLDVLTVQELAKTLNASETTIRRYLRSGKIKGQKVGAQTYVTAENLRRFLSGNQKEDLCNHHLNPN
jgi:excisionase family DNA binding protein